MNIFSVDKCLISDSPKDLTPASAKAIQSTPGESVNISLTYMAFPQPVDSMMCMRSDSVTTLSARMERIGGDRFFSYLTLDSLQESDRGAYTCRVSNGIKMPLTVEYTVTLTGKSITYYEKCMLQT